MWLTASPVDPYLIAELQDGSTVLEWFHYSYISAGGNRIVPNPMVGWVTEWLGRSASQERFYGRLLIEVCLWAISPPGQLGLPAGLLWLSWSLQQWRSDWTDSHAPSARMDLPDYHQLQPQPLFHHPGNYPEDPLLLEESSKCEYNIGRLCWEVSVKLLNLYSVIKVWIFEYNNIYYELKYSN